jgi:NADH dehydrogenase FAD-containing subunit
VDLGEGSALVDVLGVKFGGLLGALVWRGVYLYELDHNLNRVQVLFDWTRISSSGPTPPRSSRTETIAREGDL